MAAILPGCSASRHQQLRCCNWVHRMSVACVHLEGEDELWQWTNIFAMSCLPMVQVQLRRLQPRQSSAVRWHRGGRW